MAFMKYVFGALGFENDGKKSKPKKEKPKKATYNFKNGKNERVEHIDGIPVYYPASFDQSKDYGQFLRDKKAVIISIEACTKDDSERILDYYQGVVYGMSGKFITLDEGRLYLLLPQGLEVEE